MMNEIAETEKANSYLRLALPLMTRHKIPPTPMNYSVWYSHVSGNNLAVSEEIEKIIKQEDDFTEEINEKLYWEFCASKDEKDLKVLRQDLHELLLTMISEASSFSGQTEDYGNSISTSVSTLSPDVSVNEIRSVINAVIDKTRIVTMAGKVTTEVMQQTSDELEALQEAFAKAKAETLQDFLTEVPNRKAFDEKITSLITETSGARPLSLLMIDIDHFKKFNDEHGHIIGDEVLKFVAKQIKNVIRGWDFLARYGGEEFSVLLPDTRLKGATSVANNIQRYFNEARLKSAKTEKSLGKITVSTGIAMYRDDESVDAFISRADQALYLSKNRGRNTVSTEQDLP